MVGHPPLRVVPLEVCPDEQSSSHALIFDCRRHFPCTAASAVATAAATTAEDPVLYFYREFLTFVGRVRAATSLALTGADLLGLALRGSLVCAAMSLALTDTGPPEVDDGHCSLQYTGCCRTKLGGGPLAGMCPRWGWRQHWCEVD